jgi:hypothetical protein
MKCIKCNKEHDGLFGSGKYCSRSCANSRAFSIESIEKKKLANKTQKPWNFGKRYKTRSIISKCKGCGGDIEHWLSTPKKYHKECWLKVSGGYRKGSGTGKSGWYKGYWCDSSYELAWVIYQLENNIPFERNKQKFPYIWEGKTKHYIPDFIQFGEIIEIKGYVDKQVQAKLNTLSTLKIIFRKDLNKEFQYVIKKYGRDFIKLYEENPYKQLTGKCKLCGKPCIQKNVYCSRKCSGAGNNKNSKIK